MTFRRLIGGAMPNADALDIVFRHPPAQQSRRVVPAHPFNLHDRSRGCWQTEPMRPG
jgi:hypothetical protein